MRGLRTQRDRRRWRREAQDASRGEACVRLLERLAALERRRPTRYVRFLAGWLDAASGRRQGLFRAATRAIDEGLIHPALAAEVEAQMAWFDAHLPVPRLVEERAVFFYRDDARAFVERMWPLVHLLRASEVAVEMVVLLERPGRVVYEDEWQVACLPPRRERRI